MEICAQVTKFGCTRQSRNKFRSALIGTKSLTPATKFPALGKHNFLIFGTD